MNDEEYRPKQLLQDTSAVSANPDLPAFIARPEGAPVYYGFSLIEETRTDGWCFGAITGFEDPNGCEWGDGFVIAPDGARAGIVWEVGEHEMQVIAAPDQGRWGVYAVWFPRRVKTVEDLVFNFRRVLPDLQRNYTEAQNQQTDFEIV